MVADFDTIVIGLGGMGSAAAAEIAGRGARVLGLEQFGPAHDRGSSHGSTRIVRQAYFEHPDYVPLARRAYEHWDAFGLLTRTGALNLGAADSPVVAGTLASVRRWELPHEVLDRDALAERYPQFVLREGECAVYEENAGYVSPEAAVRVQLERAAAAGADLRYQTVVSSWRLTDSGVVVEVDGTEVSAFHLVLAAGAWTSRLIEPGLVPLRVVRRVMFFLDPGEHAADFDPARFPVYIFQIADGDAIYGFPHVEPDAGVKVGFHYRGPEVDPDTVERAVGDAEKAELQAVLAERIPGLRGPVLDARVCMYTKTPDEDFVLGWLPGGMGRVSVAAGFSGHGFKFTPVVGEVLADLALDGGTEHPVKFLSPSRFG